MVNMFLQIMPETVNYI